MVDHAPKLTPRLLCELVNATGVEALRKFQAGWPDFTQDAARFFSEIQRKAKQFHSAFPSASLLAGDGFPDDLRPIDYLANLLRRLWVADEEAITTLEKLHYVQDLALRGGFPFFRIHWRRENFVYQPQFVVQSVLHYLLQHSHLAKMCGNPDCDRHPYFVAGHGNDRYCSERCFEIARKEAKRAWWNEHGEGQRKAKPKRKKKK